MNLKKTIYLAAFSLLGVLLGFLVHAVVEIIYINLLVADFGKFSLGFSWDRWLVIHEGFSFGTFFGGLIFGFWQGRFWWTYAYVDKKCRKMHKHGKDCKK